METTTNSKVEPVDMKLEVVLIGVTDVDRAKAFYENLGWGLDNDAVRDELYFHKVDKGGYFAAWKEPELFSAELRAAFKSLRPAH